ncbi:hypothetical protein KJ951_04215 [Patescibacteria group bacterium]|nr:hypothetical protein [Patescibacteria group bacterium]MBU1703583.1 hypothetical protein [Patescibacteria group bacterium]MBU1954352.1 hypothetical protein [Patescibacteria group bacterium]
MTNLLMTDMTDEKLYGLCKQYGACALEARRKFMGLLPEVQRRHLYAKKGFGSVKEFAAKLAGVSEEQVRLVLRLERKFEDKPVLKIALTGGAISVNKLARVASIATTENQEHLAKMASLLPNRALEVFVRDVKEDTRTSLRCVRAMHVHSNPQQSLPDVNLLESMDTDLQKNLIERLKKGIDINQLIKELLQKHDEEIAVEKEELANGENGKVEHEKKASRYIPAKIRYHLQSEHGTKCTISTCEKSATTIHHTQRFALSQNHDPNFLAQLCREHHTIAHSIDRTYWEKRQM